MDLEYLIWFACLGFSVVQAVQVEIHPAYATSVQGQNLKVLCSVKGNPFAYCRFSVPGIGGLNLSPQIPPHQGLRYYGAGLERGECGLEITNVNDRHNGNIVCTMGYTTLAVESTATMKLTVAKPPPAPRLVVQQSRHPDGAFHENEVIYASCTVENSRPVSNISWFIGDEPIYSGLSPLVYSAGDNDLKTVSQNFSRPLKYTDSGKDLRCVASHIAQGPQDINQTLFKINVKFPPKPPSRELERFGFTIGQPGDITVKVFAHPRPIFVWRFGNQELRDGERDRSNRLLNTYSYRGQHVWDAILRISEITTAEVNQRYALHATNDLGNETYWVAISTSPAPPPEIKAGAIVGIVIAVLLILLLISMLIFARATGRWCFAADTPEPAKAPAETTDEKKPPSVHASTEYINGKEKSKDKVNTPV